MAFEGNEEPSKESVTERHGCGSVFQRKWLNFNEPFQRSLITSRDRNIPEPSWYYSTPLTSKNEPTGDLDVEQDEGPLSWSLALCVSIRYFLRTSSAIDWSTHEGIAIKLLSLINAYKIVISSPMILQLWSTDVKPIQSSLHLRVMQWSTRCNALDLGKSCCRVSISLTKPKIVEW